VRAHPQIAPISYEVTIKAVQIKLTIIFSLPSLIRTATVTAGLKWPPEIFPKRKIKQNKVTTTASAV
jgi:hypothetical protein